MNILLPDAQGCLRIHALKHSSVEFARQPSRFNRVVYAAAHVVVNPLASRDPWDSRPVVDWDATLAFRDHLWSLGLGVAEAMDTAQRGMGVPWDTAKELIERSVRHARFTDGARIVCGAGTDQLPAGPASLEAIERAYREQFDVVQGAGSRVIMMASRALAASAQTAADYLRVYGRLLQDADEPVILHWLGEMFDSTLTGYWGSRDLGEALDTVCELIERHRSKVDGIKVSLLDPAWEIALRERLPDGVRMYTGDDFNYAELIQGDDRGHSHALLGIFDPIAPVAAQALRSLAQGRVKEYREAMDPTVDLSRELFRSPTRHYKAGVVFLAWLNGHQNHFSMAGGLQSARDVLHYARVFELADRCGALIDPELAVRRMKAFLQVNAGIEQVST
ncbi:dihydrodipicolinate synthase family protein [Piscinibacter terrae]|uniref:Dihydrodipicolinate synthase family protein n=1 Tax=Piscinibacter terrae TaxID=2496871 RepID=A0A3N7HIB1_9BURK|nr:dihydrodipicolinate synthase family protein [Albitalea terrae]RQP21774.1 dihydrodipicolinate synthase family protein [Albitalea terrae]